MSTSMPTRPIAASKSPSDQRGQAALLMLGVLAAVLAGVLVLFGFGQALGARGHAQRAADLAAVSAAQVMRRNFTRLFEPAFLEGGVPNPRHLSTVVYVSLARAAALRGAVRNGANQRLVEVAFPMGRFAPTRVTVAVRDTADVKLPDDRHHPVEVGARATAEIAAGTGGPGMPADASGGGYSGPLAYRQGKPMRPDVAVAFDRMAAAARSESGLTPACHVGLPLRRRAGALVRRASGSEVGGSAGDQPAPLRHRARPRTARRLRVAGRQLRQIRLHQTLRLGGLALRVSVSAY
jgi:hypothetical protein